MRYMSLSDYVGARDAKELDPSAMNLEPRRVRGTKNPCAGCTFEEQWAETCKRAGVRAAALGLPDCDEGFVYLAVLRNQGDIFNT